jgi:hypothetical protein
MRTTTVAALAVSLAMVAGCTAEEPAEVLGVQLESPTPEEPTEEPDDAGDEAEPTDSGAADQGEDATDEPADSDTSDDAGQDEGTDTGDDGEDADDADGDGTDAAGAGDDTSDDAGASDEPAPAATRSPRPDPEVLTARDAETRTVWTTDHDSGTWIETSGTSITAEDVAVLAVGLAPTDATPDAPTREASCVVTLDAPDGRGVVAQGTVTVDLLVDDELAKRYRVTLDIDQLAAGESVELPSQDAREVALAEVDRVSCVATFTPAG